MITIFDGLHDDLNTKLVSLNGSTIKHTVFQLLNKSCHIDEAHLVPELTRKIIIEDSGFGTYNVKNGGIIYIYKEEMKSYFFEFNEKQPGRYIVNFIMVIDESELR